VLPVDFNLSAESSTTEQRTIHLAGKDLECALQRAAVGLQGPRV
jgi:hypothetical protein